MGPSGYPEVLPDEDALNTLLSEYPLQRRREIPNTYSDMSFRSLAESSRVMTSMKPERIIANCLSGNKSNQYMVVYYFYSPESNTRLSDEDFREIFFHLTDAHCDEVDDDPDPIHLISQLSQTDSTTMNAGRVVSILKSVLECNDNEDRAKLMVPLFTRLCSRDIHPLLMRMSVRAGIVRGGISSPH